ncbi:Nmad2 family putative nucleotide modification protein [Daejeonella oryzae]|uniref:Nmad2 family putative nucleotide modification protein n=1 Tax=Daejeonella oryzae TaxID=1122943 RepID=UPI0004065F9C|nr:hypothetical protein [Daejeonella oryzae]
MQKVYLYVVDRDLGFAPNPFHGFCSLATCKPRIRNTAEIDDWIFGVGGGRLKATGKCVFAMKVTRKVSFNEYWENPEFNDKKPVRNGSKAMLLGDNIYFYDSDNEVWKQAHSHHSNPDGSLNEYNKNRDTQSSKVLLSKHFYYFGSSAPLIPSEILEDIGYENGRNHRVYNFDIGSKLVEWLEKEHSESFNLALADPFNFDKGETHYSVETNRLTTK